MDVTHNTESDMIRNGILALTLLLALLCAAAICLLAAISFGVLRPFGEDVGESLKAMVGELHLDRESWVARLNRWLNELYVKAATRS